MLCPCNSNSPSSTTKPAAEYLYEIDDIMTIGHPFVRSTSSRTSCSTAKTVVYSIVWLLLLVKSAAVADAACHFPASIQTNRSSRHHVDAASHQHRIVRDWVTRVRDQFTEVDHRLIIGSNIIRTVPSTPTSTVFASGGGGRRGGGNAASPVIHTRVCLQTVHGDRYLVAHEEPGQRGGQTRYTCLQFVIRSPDVFQIRVAPVSERMDRSLCQDSSLQLDSWLIVDRNHLGRERAPCPLVGGFSMHIFDKSRNEGVCDAYLGETRMEGECQKGDGLVFRFRRQACVPQDMYMHSVQPVTCLTTWTEPATSSQTTTTAGPGRGSPVMNLRRFTLLRHPDPHYAYYWLLRTPDSVSGHTSASGSAADPDQFTAYLFKDLVADTSNQVNETRNYIRMDAVRDRPRSTAELCSDEYDICTDQMSATGSRSRALSRCTPLSGSSGPDYRLTCPSTCGLCNNTNPRRCRLPISWAGQWRMHTGNGNRNDSGEKALTIDYTAMTSSPDGEKWQCIEWLQASVDVKDSVDDETELTESMLVSDYTNGCRPRFRCVRTLRLTPALIYFQFSRSSPWPFVRNGNDSFDCRAFRYDPPPPLQSLSISPSPADSTAAFFSTSSSHTVALYNSDEVVCDLPSDLVDFRITSPPADVAETGNNSSSSAPIDCSGSLTESALGTRLELDVRCHDVRQLPVELEPGLTSFVCLDTSRSVTSLSGERTLLVSRLLSYSADDDSSSNANLPLYCWLFTEPPAGSNRRRQFQMFIGAKCEAVILKYSALRDIRPRPGQEQLPSATAIFTKPVITEQTQIPRNTLSVLSSNIEDHRTTPKPGFSWVRSTKSPARSPTLSPGDPLEESATSVQLDNVFRTRNETSPEVGETSEKTKNVVAIVAVVFILAVLQAIALCRC